MPFFAPVAGEDRRLGGVREAALESRRRPERLAGGPVMVATAPDACRLRGLRRRDCLAATAASR
jgi:hypothetical protein